MSAQDGQHQQQQHGDGSSSLASSTVRSSGSGRSRSRSSNKPPSASTHVVKKGEPHRIYWQQWIATSKHKETAADTSSININEQQQASTASSLSRRELITSSAAVRISAAAKARDLTALLRQTLHLPPLPKNKDSGTSTTSAASASNESAQQQQQKPQDSLVLVGTLYSLPRDYVQFEQELVQSNYGDPDRGGTSNSSTTGDPFHVVQTIPSDASPLVARQRMEDYLNRFLERAQQQQQQQQQQQHRSLLSSNSTLTPPPLLRPTSSRTIISPKLQWYYVPAPSTTAADHTTSAAVSDQPNNNNRVQSTILNCVELDGYCTDMDDDDGDDDDSNVDRSDAERDYENEDDDVDDDEDESLTATATTATTAEISTAEAQESEKLLEDALLLSPEEADAQWLSSQFSWFTPSPPLSSQQSQSDATTKADDVPSSLSMTKRQKQQRRRLAREDRLFADLQREIAAASSSTTSMSGYLLKRDARDTNVWRRVHCVLTDDHLWFVSRIYSHQHNSSSTEGGNSSAPTSATLRWARHGRIRLTRALLLEPNPADAASAPLVRTPYVWEIVSGRGVSHVFRASSRPLQRQWITAIQEGTVQSFERSLVRSAELLITDACVARNQRSAAVAVEPLWDKLVQRNAGEHENSREPLKIGRHVKAVLRLGLQVADYRECCRYIQSVLLNTTSPMAVAAPPPPPPSRFGSSLLRSASSSSSSLTVPRMDTTTYDMIHAAWDRAAALLVRATHVGLTVQQQQHSAPKAAAASAAEPPKLSHSVDTLCRHIDYVITGRFRRQHDPAAAIAGTNRVRTVSNDADHEFQPPPTDLFDHLLDELQIEAVAADDAISKKHLQTQQIGPVETEAKPPTLLT